MNGFVLAVIVLLLGCGPFTGVRADKNSTPVSGTFNNSQENACIHVSTFYFLTDCSYARLKPTVAGYSLPWSGPTVNPVYYAPGSEHANPDYEPVPGDDRISPSMDGRLTIDNQNTDDPSDDLISASLTVGPAARSVVVNVNELAGGPAKSQPRAVMTWTAIRHTLAPTAVDSAAPNDLGGIDYVIASKGFPELICIAGDPSDCYPSENAGKTTDGQKAEGTWAAPASVGITRDSAMAGNVGARTSAVIEDYSCTDNRGGTTCPSHNVVWSQSAEPAPGERNVNEGPGLDNLLLKVSTDQAGRVISVQGFWTNEYLIAAGPPAFQVPKGHNNSWQGGYLKLKGLRNRGDD